MSKKLKRQLLIFDLDGTLLNTLDDIGSSVNRVLIRKGFQSHPLEQYRYFVGDGSKMLVTRALPEDHRDEKTIKQYGVVSLIITSVGEKPALPSLNFNIHQLELRS